MFPAQMAYGGHHGGFPRIRGDVPILEKRIDEEREFSPHTRGCSCLQDYLKGENKVFPAYAGMFLTREWP